MSRRRGEFEHRTSIFEGAFRAWSHLGGLEPEDLEAKTAADLDPLTNPLQNDPRIEAQTKEREKKDKKKGNEINDSDEKDKVGGGSSDAKAASGCNESERQEYPYEPLPRSGLAHPFVPAILSKWLGPDADQDDTQRGLTTLRTWWQHRRNGESGCATAALGTDKMRGVVEGHTRHFFDLAHGLVAKDKERPPHTLHAKMRELEKVRTKRDKKRAGEEEAEKLAALLSKVIRLPNLPLGSPGPNDELVTPPSAASTLVAQGFERARSDGSDDTGIKAKDLAGADKDEKGSALQRLHGVKSPQENDVLCGRGGISNNHPGNKRFRKMIEEQKAVYNSSTLATKTRITRNILHTWRAQDPPGRFLKQDDNTGLWEDVGDNLARRKISHALREKDPTLRSQTMRRSWPLRDIESPHENDVLCGRRDGNLKKHPGNKRFSKMIEEHMTTYISSTYEAKTHITLSIMHKWRAQIPPGRFLKQDDNTGLWEDVGDKMARTKVSSALTSRLMQYRQREGHVNGKTRVKRTESTATTSASTAASVETHHLAEESSAVAAMNLPKLPGGVIMPPRETRNNEAAKRSAERASLINPGWDSTLCIARRMRGGGGDSPKDEEVTPPHGASGLGRVYVNDQRISPPSPPQVNNTATTETQAPGPSGPILANSPERDRYMPPVGGRRISLSSPMPGVDNVPKGNAGDHDASAVGRPPSPPGKKDGFPLPSATAISRNAGNNVVGDYFMEPLDSDEREQLDEAFRQSSNYSAATHVSANTKATLTTDGAERTRSGRKINPVQRYLDEQGKARAKTEQKSRTEGKKRERSPGNASGSQVKQTARARHPPEKGATQLVSPDMLTGADLRPRGGPVGGRRISFSSPNFSSPIPRVDNFPTGETQALRPSSVPNLGKSPEKPRDLRPTGTRYSKRKRSAATHVSANASATLSTNGTARTRSQQMINSVQESTGDTVSCAACSRDYHPDCIPVSTLTRDGNPWCCAACITPRDISASGRRKSTSTSSARATQAGAGGRTKAMAKAKTKAKENEWRRRARRQQVNSTSTSSARATQADGRSKAVAKAKDKENEWRQRARRQLVKSTSMSSRCEYSQNFDKKMDELRVYKFARGDANVPQKFVTGLGNFVSVQRTEYKKFMEGKPSNMTNERLEALNEIGFQFKGRMTFEDYLLELHEFKDRHGHTKVTKEEKRLYDWTRNMRVEYNKMLNGKPSTLLTTERLKALQDVGFDLRRQRKNFDERFRELCDFKEVYGHTRVPLQHPGGLGSYVSKLRRQCRLQMEGKPSTVTNERLEALNGIGFEINIANLWTWTWDPDEMLAQLKLHKDEHGHSNVTMESTNNSALVSWVHLQRLERRFKEQGKPSNITDEMIAQLEELNFSWDVEEEMFFDSDDELDADPNDSCDYNRYLQNVVDHSNEPRPLIPEIFKSFFNECPNNALDICSQKLGEKFDEEGKLIGLPNYESFVMVHSQQDGTKGFNMSSAPQVDLVRWSEEGMNKINGTLCKTCHSNDNWLERTLPGDRLETHRRTVKKRKYVADFKEMMTLLNDMARKRTDRNEIKQRLIDKGYEQLKRRGEKLPTYVTNYFEKYKVPDEEYFRFATV